MDNGYKWASSRVQERMMRIGQEARELGATTDDEFYTIAVKTLKEDDKRVKSTQVVTGLSAIQKLFTLQMQTESRLLYFMADEDGKPLSVVRCNGINDIPSRFTVGELTSGSIFPRLYAIPANEL